MIALALRFHALLNRWCMPAMQSLGIPLPWFTPATHESALGYSTSSSVRLSVLGGVAVVETVLAALVFLNAPAKSGAAPHMPAGCQAYVELRSVAADARDLGEPEAWVSENYRINLWSSLTNDRWRTGELAPGGQAVIVGRNEYGYKVMDGDGVEGWVSNFHVSRTLRQDADTQRACE
jgi:hypothetical protein